VGKGTEMRFVGVVRGTNPRGELIVKSNGSSHVQAGDEIVDKFEKIIGKTKRVYGPVEAPYISIRLRKRVLGSELAGIEVYLRTEEGE
jgi:rRNA processing protein Gar1